MVSRRESSLAGGGDGAAGEVGLDRPDLKGEGAARLGHRVGGTEVVDQDLGGESRRLLHGEGDVDVDEAGRVAGLGDGAARDLRGELGQTHGPRAERRTVDDPPEHGDGARLVDSGFGVDLGRLRGVGPIGEEVAFDRTGGVEVGTHAVSVADSSAPGTARILGGQSRPILGPPHHDPGLGSHRLAGPAQAPTGVVNTLHPPAGRGRRRGGEVHVERCGEVVAGQKRLVRTGIGREPERHIGALRVGGVPI